MANENTPSKKYFAEKSLQTNNPNYTHTNQRNNIGVDFQPNILDQFDLPTYHFKFFMAPTTAFQNNELDDSIQVIIAESGVSDIVIDDVEFNTIASPSAATGTGTGTTIKFKVVEPGGGGNLLDKMFLASLDLGIENWKSAPYYLELTFRARDSQSSAPVNLATQSPVAGMRWVLPLTITNINADMKTVGTTYEFEGILYGEKAQINRYFSIKRNISLSSVTTVGEALKQIEERLNNDEIEDIIAGFRYPNKYEIQVEPELRNKPLTAPKETENSNRGGSDKIALTKALDFNQGTSIDKIIDTILANTVMYQKGIKNSLQTDTNDGTNITSPDQIKKFWRVCTDCSPLAFDEGRQDYAVKVNVFVVNYDKGNLVANPAQGENDDASVSKTRLNQYITNGMLRKRYDYIFTGRNDQIINFNIQMKNMLATVIPKFSGIYSHFSASDPGMVHHDTLENIEQSRKQLTNLYNVLNNATSTEVERQRAMNEYGRTAVKVTDTAELTRQQRILDNIKNPTRLREILTAPEGSDSTIRNYRTSSATLQQDTGINPATLIDGQDQAPTTNSSNVFTNTTKTKQQPLKQFVNDYSYGLSAQLAKNAKGKKINPTVFTTGTTDNNLQYGIDSSYGSGKNFVGAFFTQVMYEGVGGSMVNLDLEIRGDPFWIHPGPVSSGYKMQPMSLESLTNPQSDTLNTYTKDNFIVIRFRTPRIYDEKIGTTEPYTEVDTITGVYNVITVDSTFSKGQFRQRLQGFIDPVIDIADLKEEIFFEDYKTNKTYDNSVAIPSTSFSNPRLNTAEIAGTAGTVETQPNYNLMDDALSFTDPLRLGEVNRLSATKPDVTQQGRDGVDYKPQSPLDSIQTLTQRLAGRRS